MAFSFTAIAQIVAALFMRPVPCKNVAITQLKSMLHSNKEWQFTLIWDDTYIPHPLHACHAGVFKRVVREGGNTTTLKTLAWEARLSLTRLSLDLLEFGTALIQTPNCSCAQTVTTVKYINYFNIFDISNPISS